VAGERPADGDIRGEVEGDLRTEEESGNVPADRFPRVVNNSVPGHVGVSGGSMGTGFEAPADGPVPVASEREVDQATGA
jgi:hypothetical protein